MVSKSQLEAKSRYEAKTYDKFLLRMRKTETDRFLQAVQKSGLSKNAFILKAIENYIDTVEKQ